MDIGFAHLAVNRKAENPLGYGMGDWQVGGQGGRQMAIGRQAGNKWMEIASTDDSMAG
jgi:hypothetical protein